VTREPTIHKSIQVNGPTLWDTYAMVKQQLRKFSLK